MKKKGLRYNFCGWIYVEEVFILRFPSTCSRPSSSSCIISSTQQSANSRKANKSVRQNPLMKNPSAIFNASEVHVCVCGAVLQSHCLVLRRKIFASEKYSCLVGISCVFCNPSCNLYVHFEQLLHRIARPPIDRVAFAGIYEDLIWLWSHPCSHSSHHRCCRSTTMMTMMTTKRRKKFAGGKEEEAKMHSLE